MSSFCPLLVRIRNVVIMPVTSKDWAYMAFCLSLARIINVVIISSKDQKEKNKMRLIDVHITEEKQYKIKEIRSQELLIKIEI